MDHGEKVVHGILVKYLCQPCPECKAVLEGAERLVKAIKAAEEMAKAAKLTFEAFGNKSLRIK